MPRRRPPTSRRDQLVNAAARHRAYTRKKLEDPVAYGKELDYARIYSLGYQAGMRKVMRTQPPRTPRTPFKTPVGTGPQLACCNQWHPITTLPHRCAQCGQVYLQRTQETARKTPSSPVKARRGGSATPTTSHTPTTAREPSHAKGH